MSMEIGAVSPNPRVFRHKRKASTGAVYVKQLFADTDQRSPKEAIKTGPNVYGKPCRIAAVTGTAPLTFSGGNF